MKARKCLIYNLILSPLVFHLPSSHFLLKTRMSGGRRMDYLFSSQSFKSLEKHQSPFKLSRILSRSRSRAQRSTIAYGSHIIPGAWGPLHLCGAKSRQRMRWPHAYWDAVLSCTCSDKCLLASSFLLPEIPLLAALFCHCLPHSFVPPIFFCSFCSTLVLRILLLRLTSKAGVSMFQAQLPISVVCKVACGSRPSF